MKKSLILLSNFLLIVKSKSYIEVNNNTLTSCSYSSTCSVSGISGLCVSKSSGCCTGTLSTGYCPGSSDIQCCTKPTCSTPAGNGNCVQTSACSGSSYAGYCDGPSDIQCCVSSSTCSTPYGNGNCVQTSSCTGTSYPGYCDGPSDIQCCVAGSTCSTPAGNGNCIQLSACSGTSYPGYCDGPTDIQCCVPGPKPSPACSYSCAQQPASSYKFGTNGLNLLTHFEGFSSTCYKDSVGVWTIGYGHACQDDSDNLPQYGVTCTSGQCSGTLTESQGREVLNTDVERFASCVASSVQVAITQNQFDAMVSFAYNNGCGGFQSSTLLSQLNAGKLTDQQAQYEFSRWHTGCLTGLERRRFTESQLFSSCATDFGCYYNSCPISYNYPYCSSNCQYCSQCGGCSGSSYSLPTCTGG